MESPSLLRNRSQRLGSDIHFKLKANNQHPDGFSKVFKKSDTIKSNMDV